METHRGRQPRLLSHDLLEIILRRDLNTPCPCSEHAQSWTIAPSCSQSRSIPSTSWRQTRGEHAMMHNSQQLRANRSGTCEDHIHGSMILAKLRKASSGPSSKLHVSDDTYLLAISIAEGRRHALPAKAQAPPPPWHEPGISASVSRGISFLPEAMHLHMTSQDGNIWVSVQTEVLRLQEKVPLSGRSQQLYRKLGQQGTCTADLMTLDRFPQHSTSPSVQKPFCKNEED